MIGPHDLGGPARHGPVVVEKDEPVFHAPWEGKMFALNILAGNWTPPGVSRRHRADAAGRVSGDIVLRTLAVPVRTLL